MDWIRRTMPILLAVLLSCGTAARGERFAVGPVIRLDIDRQTPDFTSIRELLRVMDHHIARLLRVNSGDAPRNNTVIFGVVTSPKENFSLRRLRRDAEVTLSDDYSRWCYDLDTLRKMIAVIYLTHSGLPLTSEADLDRVPWWIQIGTYEYLRRYLLYGTDVMGMNSYPDIHAVAVAGGAIYPEDIITNGNRVEDGLAFELYCSAAEQLLLTCDSLSDSRNRVLLDVLKYTSYNSALGPVEIFYRAAGKRMWQRLTSEEVGNKELSKRERLRDWFWRSLRARTVNYFSPLPSGNMAAAYKALNTVDYWVRQGEDSELPAECTLDQLWPVWDKVLRRNDVRRGLRLEIRSLARESGSEYLPLLIEMDRLLDGLPVGDREVAQLRKEEPNYPFQSRMKKVMNDFLALIHRQGEIETALQRAEARYVPLEARFYYEFKASRQEDEYWRRQRPDANKLLDRLEKEYFTE